MAQYSDNFNRADSTNLGANWTEVNLDSQIVSNTLQAVTVAQQCRIRWTADFATDNNFGQVDSTNLAQATSNFPAALCRYDSAADSCYGFRRIGNAVLASYTAQLYKVVTGTVTLLGSPVTVARAAVGTSETLYVSASGSTLVGKINGTTQHTLTDTSLTTGKRGGASVRAGAAIADCTIDNYAGGDLLITGTGGITGTGVWAGAGTRTRLGTGGVSGTGTWSGVGTRTRLGTGGITGTGLWSGSGTVTTPTPATTTGCDHLNEDGSLSLNEDGDISLLEGCGEATLPTGSGYTAGRGAAARHARLRTIIRDDDELMALI